MTLDEDSLDLIEAFLEYVEDSVVADDRYGQTTRVDAEDGSTIAIRFEAAASCYFEVAVRTDGTLIRVGFLTDDPVVGEEVEHALEGSGETAEDFLGSGFVHAGLDWLQPPVERSSEQEGQFRFTTPLEIDELLDLDADEARGKTLRMLEGYLIAFGPALADADEQAEEEPDEEE